MVNRNAVNCVVDYTNPMLKNIKSHRARVYAAMILALDRGVETILAAVEAIGETDNTIVIFTSDNGGADYIGTLTLAYRQVEFILLD
jgi:arylsulfatase A-like enzyme